jgi:hypothetical protein
MTTPTTNGKGSPGRIPPPLPLIPEVFKTLECEEALGFKILSIPGDDDAPKISVKIRPIKGLETLRKCLTFFREAEKIKEGFNANNHPKYHVLLKCMLIGPALLAYTHAVNRAHALHWKTTQEDLVATRKREMNANGDRPMTENQIVLLRNTVLKPPIDGAMIKSGVQNVVKYMAPVKALAKQHAWMHCYCRKPQDMTTKVYVNHLYRINKEELPRLPPKFDDTQKEIQRRHC